MGGESADQRLISELAAIRELDPNKLLSYLIFDEHQMIHR
jgi:hypothetical protein